MILFRTKYFYCLLVWDVIMLGFNWYNIEWYINKWGYNGMFICCAGAAAQCSKASRTVVSGLA